MPRAEKDKVNNINTVRLTSGQTDILSFFPSASPTPSVSPLLLTASPSPSTTLTALSVGPHIGRYCGQTSPGRVISYTGILSMTITTDNAIAKEGFSANYTIRERSLPPGHEDEGEELTGEREGGRGLRAFRRSGAALFLDIPRLLGQNVPILT